MHSRGYFLTLFWRRIVLIGDNVGCYFPSRLLEYCSQNIFICLQLTQHACQPLDVAVFRPAKIKWGDTLDTCRGESRCVDNLPKVAFSSLFSKHMKRLKSQNFVSGFRACSIFPLDWHELFTRLPSANATDGVNEFASPFRRF